MYGEYTSRSDADVSIWLIVGMIVRLSMRMGYHRDPCHFPALSPFQGEMRRRVWIYLRQCDIMFSFQLSMPNMVKNLDCDTAPPRNIFEYEFGLHSKALPPERLPTEATPVSYMLAKSRLALVFSDIVSDLNALRSTATYDDVMRKDAELREMRRTMPNHLQFRPLEESSHDPASLIMQRFHVDLLYQKCICVLHRKYLIRARTNNRYAHSRRASVEAALVTLSHQVQLRKESLQGGRLRSMKWAISSLTSGDFLLGAMIVCLDLHYDSITEQYDRFFWTAEQTKRMYQALETSNRIWQEEKDNSIEAYKASNTLSIMLEKLRSSGPQYPSNYEPQVPTDAFAQFGDNLQPEHSAAMTLGMLSSGGIPQNNTQTFSPLPPINNSVGMMKYSNVDMSMDEPPIRSGLTPNYSMDGVNSGNLGNSGGALSPFSQVFGNMGNLMDMPANLDWVRVPAVVQDTTSIGIKADS